MRGGFEPALCAFENDRCDLHFGNNGVEMGFCTEGFNALLGLFGFKKERVCERELK